MHPTLQVTVIDFTIGECNVGMGTLIPNRIHASLGKHYGDIDAIDLCDERNVFV